MPRTASAMMKMGFVVVPSGTDPEGSTTKVIFVVNLLQFKLSVDNEQDYHENRTECNALALQR